MPKVPVLYVALMLVVASLHGQNPTNRAGLPGNAVRELINDGTENLYFDPINDTIRYKKIADNFYRGPHGKVFLLTQRMFGATDTIAMVEYFRDMSDFMDLKSYKRIDDVFFLNKQKVYMWVATSDGEVAYEIVGADAASFIPFEEISGGVDKRNVFYWDLRKGSIEIIPGANPKTIKVLCPADECWNCGGCYFIDDKRVFFAHTVVPDADSKTFHLLTEAGVDAADQHAKYRQGSKIR
jgi:hypothetical protein